MLDAVKPEAMFAVAAALAGGQLGNGLRKMSF
jgi:hypothetical protein